MQTPQLDYCANGCGNRLVRLYYGVRSCNRCWRKRERVLADRKYQMTQAKHPCGPCTAIVSHSRIECPTLGIISSNRHKRIFQQDASQARSTLGLDSDGPMQAPHGQQRVSPRRQGRPAAHSGVATISLRGSSSLQARVSGRTGTASGQHAAGTHVGDKASLAMPLTSPSPYRMD